MQLIFLSLFLLQLIYCYRIFNSHPLQSWHSLFFFSSVGPVANATDVLQPSKLIVLTLSPSLFGRSNVRHQVPPRPQRRQRSQQRKVELCGRELTGKFNPKLRLPHQSRDVLHAANLRHGNHGFTSLTKEDVLINFFVSNNPGLNPQTWVLKGSTLPLDQRSRLAQLTSKSAKHHILSLCLSPKPSTLPFYPHYTGCYLQQSSLE